MLIGFIGAPCSGKTTTAARLFAELKDNGTPAEFITEEARMYIAVKRLECQDRGGTFTLNDQDQFSISGNQFDKEYTMIRAAPTSVVVSDSCVLNSSLYMSDDFYRSSVVKNRMEAALANYDLLFVCAPVRLSNSLDSNRVHDKAQILVIQSKIDKLLQDYRIYPPKTMVLGGTTSVRTAMALSTVYERIGRANN